MAPEPPARDEAPPDYSGALDLTGRGVVVLGAGRGIGRQAAHAVAQAGGAVLCVDVDAERAEAVAAEVGGSAHHADISRRPDMEALFDAAPALLGGTVHGVVGVPAANVVSPIDDIDDLQFDRMVDGNLRYGVLAIQLGARAMAGGGSIVLVVSGAGLFASAQRSLYGATKAGMISLTKSAAVEYGARRIRVNAVAPGATLTPGVMPHRQSFEDFGRTTIPLGRVCQPSDIAASILFLLSDLGAMVTGQTLLVDGGLSLVRVQPQM